MILLITFITFSTILLIFIIVFYSQYLDQYRKKLRRPSKAEMDRRLEQREETLQENIKKSLNGKYEGKKHYLRQSPTSWSLKYCRYCGTELVNVSFTTFCYRYEDTGLYYCMNCNIETQDYMNGERIIDH